MTTIEVFAVTNRHTLDVFKICKTKEEATEIANFFNLMTYYKLWEVTPCYGKVDTL